MLSLNVTSQEKMKQHIYVFRNIRNSVSHCFNVLQGCDSVSDSSFDKEDLMMHLFNFEQIFYTTDIILTSLLGCPWFPFVNFVSIHSSCSWFNHT